MKYYCNYCDAILDEEDLHHRFAEEEDCVPRGTKVATCPYCNEADGLEEADECEICGEAIKPDDHLCNECKHTLHDDVENLVLRFRGDYFEAKDKFLDYIERSWF